jgi:hypothetical protein
LELKDIIYLGYSFIGQYNMNFIIHLPINNQLNIDNEKIDKFIDLFSSDIGELRSNIQNSRFLDKNIFYYSSPIRYKPLIRNDNFLICPMTTLLYWQITGGLYYLVEKDGTFANQFGLAFQEYIGHIINLVNREGNLHLFPEEKYHVSKNPKDTVDWIIEDNSANLFIECKTKRIQQGAKESLDISDALQTDLEILSKYVIQIFKTYLDYEKNLYPQFKLNLKSTSFILCTLEEWHINLS